MRVWLFLLGGVLVWAADFFLLYGIVSIFLMTPLSRGLALAVTVAAVAADAWLFWRSWRWQASADDDYDRWLARMALLVAAISAIAVLWQGFPAIFV